MTERRRKTQGDREKEKDTRWQREGERHKVTERRRKTQGGREKEKDTR